MNVAVWLSLPPRTANLICNARAVARPASPGCGARSTRTLDDAPFANLHVQHRVEMKELALVVCGNLGPSPGSRPGSRNTTTTAATPHSGCGPRSPTSSPSRPVKLQQVQSRRHERPAPAHRSCDRVLDGVKAMPSGWPSASLDPDSGRPSRGDEREPAQGEPQIQVSTVSGDCHCSVPVSIVCRVRISRFAGPGRMVLLGFHGRDGGLAGVLVGRGDQPGEVAADPPNGVTVIKSSTPGALNLQENHQRSSSAPAAPSLAIPGTPH